MPKGKTNRSKNKVAPIRSAIKRTETSKKPAVRKRAASKANKLLSKVRFNRFESAKKDAAKGKAVKRTLKKPTVRPKKKVAAKKAVAKFNNGGRVKKKVAGADAPKRVRKAKPITSAELKALGPVGSAARLASSPRNAKTKELATLGPVGAVARIAMGKPKGSRKASPRKAKPRNVTPIESHMTSAELKKRSKKKPKNLIDKIGFGLEDLSSRYMAGRRSANRARRGIVRTQSDLDIMDADRRGALFTRRSNSLGRPNKREVELRQLLSIPVTAKNAPIIHLAMQGKEIPDSPLKRQMLAQSGTIRKRRGKSPSTATPLAAHLTSAELKKRNARKKPKKATSVAKG